MNVLLYRVGRNLNRAYRTCEAFGVSELNLLECPDAHLAGNLFLAENRVVVRTITEWPYPLHILALETCYRNSLYTLPKRCWENIHTILIGGETAGLPRLVRAQYKVSIPQQGRISGLTVEAALAIGLYEWRRHVVV